MNNRGFTLLELMVSVSIMTIIGILAFVAVRSSTMSMSLSDAKGRAQGDIRDVMMSISSELELAAKRGDSSFSPALRGLEVFRNPVSNSPVEVVFQIPLDSTGENWSSPIRYRYITEDVNGNGFLDDGEDSDGDQVLTRRLLRMQDVNGDGSIDDDEMMPLGSANNLSDVDFSFPAGQSDVLVVTLSSSATIMSSVAKGSGGVVTKNEVSVRMSSKIYLHN